MYPRTKLRVENAADLTSSNYDAGLPDKRILDVLRQNTALGAWICLPRCASAVLTENHRPLFFPSEQAYEPSGQIGSPQQPIHVVPAKRKAPSYSNHGS
jgi:hypothetical protein